MHSTIIGQPKHSLDTPVLLVDLDVLERNIERMTRTIIHEAGVGWRPHTKAMKTPALAHKLLDAGAHGITCAKLGEAEVMAAAGIRDILIANQIVGDQKIKRLVNLRKQADVMVGVDSVENVEALHRAAIEMGIRLRVLIEVNTGMNRAGVELGEPTLELAREIIQREGVKFSGLMTWESHALMITDIDEKRRAITEALKRVTETADLCRAEGIPVDIISCGGTGTYWISAFQPGITEIEAGGGVYCDIRYRTIFGVDHEYAMTVLSTVTSRPTPTRIICDAGKKTMSSDAGVPEAMGLEVESTGFSAEHGTINLKKPEESPRIGDLIEFIVGYSDTTVVLHDTMIGIRNGTVETVWPLLGRGKLK